MERFLKRMNNHVDQKENKYSHVVGIIPTGWAATSKWNREHATSTKGNASIVLCPYSEHSSFNELLEFVKGIKPRHVEPIVFSNPTDRHSLLTRLSSLVDRDANKRKFLALMFGTKQKGGGSNKKTGQSSRSGGKRQKLLFHSTSSS